MKKSNAKEKICGLASYAVLTVLTVAACWFFAGRYGVFGANMDWISQHSVFPEDFRQPETGDGGKGGQGDGAHGQAADIGGLLLQLAALSVQVPQQRENPLAVLGGTDAGTGADQKGKTQLCLQGLDDITESGLGVPQLFRRPCQVAQVNGGEQGHAFVLVHGASFPGRDRGEPFGSIGKSNDKGGFSLFYKGKWV